MIDYFLLFLNRNRLMTKYYEKKINNFLNLWIRCPGCIMNVCLSLSTIASSNITFNQLLGPYIMMGAMYWNGIYFMNQVVTDYSVYKYMNRA